LRHSEAPRSRRCGVDHCCRLQRDQSFLECREIAILLPDVRHERRPQTDEASWRTSALWEGQAATGPVLMGLTIAEYGLHIVSIRGKYKSGVVKRCRSLFASIGSAVVRSTSAYRSGVESVYFHAALGDESAVLSGRMWMEWIYPEDRTIEAVSDSVGAFVLWHLHCAAHAKRAQASIIEGNRGSDVRNTDACLIERGIFSCGLTLEMSSGPNCAKRPLQPPLDGRVRALAVEGHVRNRP
jgi:hypothetical protein